MKIHKLFFLGAAFALVSLAVTYQAEGGDSRTRLRAYLSNSTDTEGHADWEQRGLNCTSDGTRCRLGFEIEDLPNTATSCTCRFFIGETSDVPQKITATAIAQICDSQDLRNRNGTPESLFSHEFVEGDTVECEIYQNGTPLDTLTGTFEEK
jgi:hypothetical protein